MSPPRVALVVTCLADLFRPEVGFAAAKLLEEAGCDVVVPAQTCCGQPAYNAGDTRDAAALARKMIVACEAYDNVVVPSGSCAGMIRVHYPDLLKDDRAFAARARALAEKTHELMAFVAEQRGPATRTPCARICAYHDSCSSLRELKAGGAARALLASVPGLETRDIPDTEVCCGFGGFFSVKFPEISARMADDKIANAQATGADMVVSADLGCLLHLAGRMARTGVRLEVRHAAEVLAGMTNTPGIGEDEP